MATLPSDFGAVTDGPAPAFLILGPCAFEGRDHCLMMAEAIAALAHRFDRTFIFKVSFDKANRTRRASYRGRGLDEALETFDEIRAEFALPILTDVHEAWQCPIVSSHVDILQIPAFLSRQTDLLEAAGASRLPVNIKKGQFSAPSDMKWAAEKVRFLGGKPLVCERGTFFGYGDLVNDFRGLGLMRSECNAPIVFDATHSAQRPGLGGGTTSGDRSVVLDLMRAALAVGVDGIFIETHNDPDEALSDSATMIPLDDLDHILKECFDLDVFSKEQLRIRALNKREL